MARDRFRYFRIEARELAQQLGQGVLDLEKGTPPADLIARMLRVAHTLKGAARVVKRPDIADLAHAVEDVLAPLRESHAAVPRERIDDLLKLLDEIGNQVATLTPPSSPAALPATAAGVDSEDLFRAFRPEMHETEGLLDAMSEAQGQVMALHPLVNRVGRVRQLAELVVDHLAAPGQRDGRPGDRATLQNTRSLAEDLRDTVTTIERDFADCVDDVSRNFREARSAAERLRLGPANAVFTLLERTARDTAQALGKQVTFQGRGGDVRLDPQVLGVAQGALVQIVRNAVAHGIEPAAERTAAGKTPFGSVTVDVMRHGQSVVFSCTDDGRGIDLEAIRRLAHLKGLSAAARDMSKAEDLLALLLESGVSTSTTVTGVSGRGVGLDVVREAAERLGGRVSVRTDAGRGTTIEMFVPLTLASFSGLLVETLGVTAIVPADAVRATERISQEAVVRMPGTQAIVYDGQTIPLGSLARALRQDSSPTRPTGRSSVVVVQGRSSTAALSVDRIVGINTVVFRPLPDLAPAAAFVAGASLDAAGTPQLVFDPDALVTAIERMASVADEVDTARPAILVIDDSLTTRMLEQSILESAGYAVDLAESAEDALQKARTSRYALFLVDVEMPGMDGFTFIERVRAEPALRDVPSILVTSRNSPDDRRRGADVGARAYIVKSEFDQGVLLDHIRELVG
jgi:two-component system chemotaxis sensor kinase CheA